MRVSVDLQTTCKRPETAFRRFSKKHSQNAVVRAWLPWMEESFENQEFENSSVDEQGGYGYGIEDLGGEYYIWLTCYGIYAKTEEAAPPPPFRVDGEHNGTIAQALIDAGYSAT